MSGKVISEFLAMYWVCYSSQFLAWKCCIFCSRYCFWNCYRI